MIAQRSALTAALRRKLEFEGKYRTDKLAIYLDDFEVADLEGAPFSSPALVDGDTALVTLKTGVKIVDDRVAFVKYHPDLYKAALVSGPTILDATDGMTRIQFRLEVTEDLDIFKLPYAVKLYVTE